MQSDLIEAVILNETYIELGLNQFIELMKGETGFYDARNLKPEF